MIHSEGRSLTKDMFNNYLINESGKNYKKILTVYFYVFAKNAKKDEVEKRMELPSIILQDKLISVSEFKGIFDEVMLNMYIEFADQPFFVHAFAKIIVDLYKNKLIGKDQLNLY